MAVPKSFLDSTRRMVVLWLERGCWMVGVIYRRCAAAPIAADSPHPQRDADATRHYPTLFRILLPHILFSDHIFSPSLRYLRKSCIFSTKITTASGVPPRNFDASSRSPSNSSCQTSLNFFPYGRRESSRLEETPFVIHFAVSVSPSSPFASRIASMTD